MNVARSVIASLLASTSLLYGGPAAAVLVENSGLEVRAVVDSDGRLGPAVPFSTKTESEIDLPFDRSIVSASDALAGTFAYSAISDIGNQVLKIQGSLTNTTATRWFGQGLPLINVYAQAKDVLSLTAPVAGTYEVTLLLEIDGTLTTTPTEGEVFANSSLSFGLLSGGLNDTDANIYKAPGAFTDVLTVTKQVTFAQDGATVQMDFDTFISFTALAVPANSTVAGDLSNTASLVLVLPSAVTLAGSESGTFGVPIPVPEPSAYALMLAGLAFMGVVAARRGSRSR